MKSDMQVSVLGKPSIPYSVFVQQLFKSGIDILNASTPLREELNHAAMGIAGEAGEIVDAIKKYTIYNKELDRKNVIEELGDLRFYMVAIQNLLCISDSEIIMANVGKLGKRYAEGYSDKQAQERLDKVQEAFPNDVVTCYPPATEASEFSAFKAALQELVDYVPGSSAPLSDMAKHILNSMDNYS